MNVGKNFFSSFQFLKAWTNPSFRNEFEDESHELQLICFRITCVTLTFFVLCFSFIDYLIIPTFATYFLKIRLACSSFIALLFLITLFFPEFVRRNTPFFYFLVFVGTSAFLSWMVMLTGGHRSIYYAGINLVILMQAGLMPINMGYVLFNSFAVYMIYLLPILWFDSLISPAHLVNNSAFMLMTTILTLISNTFLYFLRFQEFYGRKSLHGLNKQLHELAMKDGLTGLWNNRFLKHQLEVAVKFAKRYSTPFSLLMIDLDHFKEFNDRYGHLVGDHILQDIAKAKIFK
jgi:predicted signal transduction protein with EAL and GGDEF domain